MTHEVDMHARAVGAVMRVTLARLLAHTGVGEQLRVGLHRAPSRRACFRMVFHRFELFLHKK